GGPDRTPGTRAAGTGSPALDLLLQQLQALLEARPRPDGDAEEPASQAPVRLPAVAHDEGLGDDGLPGGIRREIEGDLEPRPDGLAQRSADEEPAAGEVAQRASMLDAVPPESHRPSDRGALSVSREDPQVPPHAVEDRGLVHRPGKDLVGARPPAGLGGFRAVREDDDRRLR